MIWAKLRRSKWKYPTQVIKLSKEKGRLELGEKAAIANIEVSMGGKLRYVKTKHTPTQWVFCVPKGQSFRERA